jgi:hypothetical protein
MSRFANLAAKAENTGEPLQTELVTRRYRAISRPNCPWRSTTACANTISAYKRLWLRLFNDILRKYCASPIGD